MNIRPCPISKTYVPSVFQILIFFSQKALSNEQLRELGQILATTTNLLNERVQLKELKEDHAKLKFVRKSIRSFCLVHLGERG